MQYCSLQHQTLLPSPVTSTAGCCFCLGSVSSFFLELFLHSSPVVYWAPTDLEVHLSVSYLFAFSYSSWGFQGKNTEVVCHSLLQCTTLCQTSPPCSPILDGPTHRTRPRFPHRYFQPSGSFHKPIIFIHQKAGRIKSTITENEPN